MAQPPMTQEQFERYLDTADIHNIKVYRCTACGTEMTSRASMAGTANHCRRNKDGSTAHVEFISQKTREEVRAEEMKRLGLNFSN